MPSVWRYGQMVWAGRSWVQVPPPLPVRRIHSSEGCRDERRQERQWPSSFDSLPIRPAAMLPPSLSTTVMLSLLRDSQPRRPDRSCLSPVPSSPLSGFCSHTPRTTGAILVKAATAREGPRPAAMNPTDSTPCHAGNGSDHSGCSSQRIDVPAFSDCRRPFWSLPVSQLPYRQPCASC